MVYGEGEKVCVWIKRCMWIIISPRVGRLILLSRVILGLTGVFHGCFVCSVRESWNHLSTPLDVDDECETEKSFRKGKATIGARGWEENKIYMFHKLESTI